MTQRPDHDEWTIKQLQEMHAQFDAHNVVNINGEETPGTTPRPEPTADDDVTVKLCQCYECNAIRQFDTTAEIKKSIAQQRARNDMVQALQKFAANIGAELPPDLIEFLQRPDE